MPFGSTFLSIMAISAERTSKCSMDLYSMRQAAHGFDVYRTFA